MKRKNISAIFDWIESHWWIFLLAFLLLLGAFWYFIKNPMQEYHFPSLVKPALIVVSFMQLAVLVLLVIKKSWHRFFYMLSAIIVCAFLWNRGELYSIFTYGMADHFGKRHPIPSDMECFLPEETELSATESNKDTWILLSEGVQPGMYKYSIFLPPLGNGNVHLKGFEAVTDFALTVEEKHQKIQVPVSSNTEFGEIASGEFTLYEGVWNEPYAVRLELWFEDSESHESKKLMEKIYKLEGWMR